MKAPEIPGKIIAQIANDPEINKNQLELFVIMDVVILIILSLFPILSLYLPVLAGFYTP